jgi:hypothetical protein
LVEFASGESMWSFGSGQARFEGVDGSLTNFTMSIPGHGFLAYVFNLNAANRQAGQANVSAGAAGGSLFQGSVHLGTGENYISVDATDSDQIRSVLVETAVPLDDVRQSRVGGFGVSVAAADVPEPGSWALLNGGLVALGVLVRRKWSRN